MDIVLGNLDKTNLYALCNDIEAKSDLGNIITGCGEIFTSFGARSARGKMAKNVGLRVNWLKLLVCERVTRV